MNEKYSLEEGRYVRKKGIHDIFLFINVYEVKSIFGRIEPSDNRTGWKRLDVTKIDAHDKKCLENLKNFNLSEREIVLDILKEFTDVNVW